MSSPGSVAEIKSRLPVAEIVGETVVLKKAGSTWKGLCPFHGEKTPSFTVSPERESWHCFGCGEHGDIFTFVMKRDGIDFREALGRLAERAGVELSAAGAREDRRRKRLRDALEAAIGWYRDVLRQANQAEPARRYLAERGFTEETLEQFGIGFAPDSWDALSTRLASRGFSSEEMISAGLASMGQRGRPVDRFRRRIIIPIRDATGKPTGLGGRVMPDGEGPKYLNSPATALFDKSRTLYGIDLARTAIRREKLAVIVEGYTDVMAAHQAGFTNVVASMGTALTRGQVEIVTRYADAITLAYDVDLAGEAATERGLLDELGPSQSVTKLRVIRIPAGKDPAELLQTDPGAWREAIDNAKPLIDYFMEREAARVDLNTVEGRREMAGRVLAKLQRVTDAVVQDLYVQELSRIVQVDERILREGLARPRVQRQSRTAGGAGRARNAGARPGGDRDPGAPVPPSCTDCRSGRQSAALRATRGRCPGRGLDGLGRTVGQRPGGGRWLPDRSRPDLRRPGAHRHPGRRLAAAAGRQPWPPKPSACADCDSARRGSRKPSAMGATCSRMPNVTATASCSSKLKPTSPSSAARRPRSPSC